jgi:hypothetical protein
MTLPDLVANLLAMSDWTDSDEQAQILRQAATALEASRLTDAEREAIEWALEEGVWSYGDPEDWTKAERLRAFLRGLLERMR